MGLNATMKTNAKRALSGAWGAAIGVLFITTVPMIIINLIETAIRTISGVSEFVDYSATPSLAFDDMANVAVVSTIISLAISLLIFLVMSPLQQGCARWFYQRTGGEQEGVSAVFRYFETGRDYFRSLGLSFQIGVRTLLWAMLLVVPLVGVSALVGVLADKMEGGLPNSAMAVSMFLLAIWMILLVVMMVFVTLRYFLAPYLLAEHPDWKASACIKQGVRLVKGHKADLFGFMLSFIGWYLLCFFVLPMFYVMPYMNAAYAMYGRYLIQLGESGAEGDATREYAYKPEIDRYMEQQTAAREEPAAREPGQPADDGPDRPEV